jgi:hypothetical protein
MENISWPDRVRNVEVLHRVKKERNILHTLKRRKADWIDHTLHRNCVLQDVSEEMLKGNIEVMGRQRKKGT